MRTKKPTSETINPVAVDIEGLQKLLSVGYRSALQTAAAAGAEFRIGKRRLFSVAKINAYIESQSGKTAESED